MAQSSSDPKSPNLKPPTFHSQTKLVLLDVVATDAKGVPLKNLSRADFTVYEDGEPRSIDQFEVHFGAAHTEMAQTNLPEVTPLPQGGVNTYENSVKRTTANGLTIVLFDMVNTAFSDQQNARKQLLEVVKQLSTDVPIALFTLTSRLELLQEPTTDRAQLLAAVEKVHTYRSPFFTSEIEAQRLDAHAMYVFIASGRGNSVVAASRVSSPFTTGESAAYEAQRRVEATLATMQSISRVVAGYPGRKNLLWLSGSFTVQLEPKANPSITSAGDPRRRNFSDARDYTSLVREVAQLLASTRVSVYPIDIRGFGAGGVDISAETGGAVALLGMDGKLLREQAVTRMAENGSMRSLAEETGGRAFVNTNGLKDAMLRGIEDSDSYYTLAFKPSGPDTGDSYHKLEIRLNHPDAKLIYRRGYYRTDAAPRGLAGRSQLIAALEPEVPDATMLTFRASIAAPDATHKDVRVQYLIDTNGISLSNTPEGKKRALVDVLVIAFKRKGQTLWPVQSASHTLVATIPTNALEQVQRNGYPAHQEFVLPPGDYTLRLGIRDRATGAIGTVTVPVVTIAASDEAAAAKN